MKKEILLLIFVILFSCSKDQVNVTIKNPTDYNRLDELAEIEIGTSQLKHLNLEDDEVYIVKDNEGNIIPSQITYDNKLIFQPVLKGGESKKFTITTGSPIEFTPMVYGRLYPERKDDFAWENDRVGFRFYGAALKEIQAPTSALDLFYKRTPDMVLDKWYINDMSGKASYHVDHGEGCDPYAVGQSLGAGAIAAYADGQIIRNENFEVSEVLDNGPLRITFKLKYPDLKVNNELSVIDEKQISLDAGSQLTKIVQNYGNVNIEAAAGIVKRATGNDSVIVAADHSYLIYEEPEDGKNGNIFISLVFPNKFDKYQNNILKENNSELLHSLAIKKYNKTPLIYYTGFGWNKYGFQTLEDYENYVRKFKNSLNMPLEVYYEK